VPLSPGGFNVAAADQPRKSALGGHRVAVAVLASRWPRLSSRGNKHGRATFMRYIALQCGRGWRKPHGEPAGAW
jgi:hypothetical protein